MRHSMRGCRNKKGFTLVELVVVLILISVVAAIAVPSYLGYVDDTKERQCELNRKRLAAYLDDARVTSSDVKMEEILEKYSYIDSDDAIKCPTGVDYQYEANGAIVCPKHGGTVVIGRHENVVTADAGVDAGTKDETVSGGEGTNPPSTGGNGGNNGEGGNGEDSGNSGNSGNGDNGGNGGNGGNSEDSGNSGNGGTGTNGGNNEETEPAIPVHLTVEPASKIIHKGETVTLTASVLPADVVCDYEWSVTDDTVVSLSSTYGSSINVTGMKADSTTIVTCTATPRDSSLKLTEDSVLKKNATVTVEAGKEFSSNVLISGGNSSEKTIEIWLNSCRDIQNLGLPSNGTWSSSDAEVTQYGQAKFEDNLEGRQYHFVYTAPNGDEYSIIARLVYPIGGVNDQYGFWTKGAGSGSPDGNDLTVGSEKQIWLAYIPAHTTDKSSIQWTIDTPDIVEFTDLWEAPGATIRTIRALGAGTAKIHATVNNEYENKQSTYEWNIKLIHKKLESVSCDPVTLMEGTTMTMETLAAQCHFTPSEDINIDGLLFSVDGGYDQNIVDISDGIIMAKKAGETTLTVRVKDTQQTVNANEITTACKVTVTEDPSMLKSISVDPIYIKVGEETDIQVNFMPNTADMTDVEYVFSDFDTSYINILSDRNPKAVKGIREVNETWVTVKAIRNGSELVSSKFKVVVTGDDNKLAGIRLEKKKDALMQGETANITVAPIETGDIVIYPVPNTASLDGFNFNAWNNNYNGIFSVNNMTVTANEIGEAMLKVDATRHSPNYEHYDAEIQIEVVADPNKPTGIRVEPASLVIEEGEEVEVTVYPDTSGEIVIKPVPDNTSIEDCEFNCKIDDGRVSVI